MGCGFNCTVSGTEKLPWIATVRGRAGFAIDRALLYGTGGVAFTDASNNLTATGLGTIFDASSINIGWTAGGGVEFALAPNWTIRAEYLFIGTNIKLNGNLAVIGGAVSQSANANDSIVRVGVNFKYP